MKQYRLNFDWLEYKKGHVFCFEREEGGILFGSNGFWWSLNIIDLLLKSGALSLVEEVELPKKLDINFLEGAGAPNATILVARGHNSLIDYLKANKK